MRVQKLVVLSLLPSKLELLLCYASFAVLLAIPPRAPCNAVPLLASACQYGASCLPPHVFVATCTLPATPNSFVPLLNAQAGGAPELLSIVLEGESLFNDASSLTMFEVSRGLTASCQLFSNA